MRGLANYIDVSGHVKISIADAVQRENINSPVGNVM